MNHPRGSACDYSLFPSRVPLWTRRTDTSGYTARSVEYLCLCKRQAHAYHGSWWASGSRLSLLSWWPLCRNNIQSHMGYSPLGTLSMQYISVMTLYRFQSWVCLLNDIFRQCFHYIGCHKWEHAVQLATTAQQYVCMHSATWVITCRTCVEVSVNTEQAWRWILPALRLVRRDPEGHVALEDPGKKSGHT